MAVEKKKHGGKRPNSGRKSKAEELGLAQLLDRCWTTADREACIERLAAQARQGEYEATKILMSYAYGKPIDRKEISGPEGVPLMQPTINVYASESKQPD
jgi:chromosome segregation and condensation protein ScpB